MAKRVFLIGVLALAMTAATVVPPAHSDSGDAFDRCIGCHRATGLGIPGYAPPLAGHAPTIEKAQGGREFLIEVLLYGLKGEIRVDGKSFHATMPAFGDLDDGRIAATLNKVMNSWGNEKLLPAGFAPFTAGEVKALRGRALTSEQVHAIRGKLAFK